jgi:hypothetical protein
VDRDRRRDHRDPADLEWLSRVDHQLLIGPRASPVRSPLAEFTTSAPREGDKWAEVASSARGAGATVKS